MQPPEGATGGWVVKPIDPALNSLLFSSEGSQNNKIIKVRISLP